MKLIVCIPCGLLVLSTCSLLLSGCSDSSMESELERFMGRVPTKNTTTPTTESELETLTTTTTTLEEKLETGTTTRKTTTKTTTTTTTTLEEKLETGTTTITTTTKTTTRTSLEFVDNALGRVSWHR